VLRFERALPRGKRFREGGESARRFARTLYSRVIIHWERVHLECITAATKQSVYIVRARIAANMALAAVGYDVTAVPPPFGSFEQRRSISTSSHSFDRLSYQEDRRLFY
jgi:hypothetical protein